MTTTSWMEALRQHDQEHLIQYWDQLTSKQQESLSAQLAEIDFSQLKSLYSGNEDAPDWSDLATKAEQPPAIRLGHEPIDFSMADATSAGEKAISQGKVAMVLAAGGQGTRLGFDQPKGMFQIGPLSNRTLFEMHVDRLRALMSRYGASIPLYIMTSPATDAETRAYFESNNRLGLSENELRIFCQGTMPAVDDKTGKVLLASQHEIALSPNGHGGLLAALDRCGCLKEADERGIEQLFYLQIDNPLVPVCDPTMIGIQILSKSQVLTQVVKKRFPLEKVGNVVSIDGRTQIIEYSDLPASAAEQKAPDGSLKLWAGNIAVHVFEREFLKAMRTNKDALPFHRAHKAVPFVDANGQTIKPSSPNAYKFERFIFDLLPMAERSIVVEGDATKVFAPVKNADGAPTDTPEASRNAISNLHKSWLEEAGAIVDDGIVVEIHPAWAMDANDVKAKIEPGLKVQKPTYFHN